MVNNDLSGRIQVPYLEEIARPFSDYSISQNDYYELFGNKKKQKLLYLTRLDENDINKWGNLDIKLTPIETN